jgi:hypothetical protein
MMFEVKGNTQSGSCPIKETVMLFPQGVSCFFHFGAAAPKTMASVRELMVIPCDAFPT